MLWTYCVRCVSHQHYFAVSVYPLVQKLAVVQNPLRRVLVHKRYSLANSGIERLKLSLNFTPLTCSGPALLGAVIIRVDESHNVQQCIFADRKGQKVLVWTQPAHRVRIEWPPRFEILDWN